MDARSHRSADVSSVKLLDLLSLAQRRIIRRARKETLWKELQEAAAQGRRRAFSDTCI